ncbi:hypothetical protein [Methanooceanicella nereidis]|uniref:hypothetical protein n=1 Tax=Methanooceanicella nereidis TaxID=2052831 RepID=UPI001E5C2113|nr:hypothetical protein [Methanocella sp. CWC-04]
MSDSSIIRTLVRWTTYLFVFEACLLVFTQSDISLVQKIGVTAAIMSFAVVFIGAFKD